MTGPLRAPFPWFGGKSRVADIVWERFGDTPNYVEPFAGSLAVLLGRPHEAGIETVNDADAYLSNFWRAVQHDPEGVARHADWPVNEADLHARHLWLVRTGADRVERLKTDPDFFDVQIAGWWVWGLCQWIGSGWCSLHHLGGCEVPAAAASPGEAAVPARQLHHLGSGRGVHRKLPHLAGDRGVHRQLHHLAGHMGLHAVPTIEPLVAWLQALAARLRRVRVCCGDWSRILGYSPTAHNGLTAVFLDPPYSLSEREEVYSTESDVAHEVARWAIEHGDDPMLRIALCGYQGEHRLPSTWTPVPWKAHGGYGSQGSGRGAANAHREMVWFSPHCLRPEFAQPPLLGLTG